MSTHAQARTRTRTLLIVTAAQRDAANAVAVQVAGPYAALTFDVPYQMGKAQTPKPTHYVACWNMSNVQVSEFRKRMAAQISGKSVEAISIAERANPRDQLKSKALTPSKG